MTRFSSLVAIAAVAAVTSDALVPGADAARLGLSQRRSLLQNRNGNFNGNFNIDSFRNGNFNGNNNNRFSFFNGNRNGARLATG
jgi:hypothetical protein